MTDFSNINVYFLVVSESILIKRDIIVKKGGGGGGGGCSKHKIPYAVLIGK
jgi:hypothetical protein